MFITNTIKENKKMAKINIDGVQNAESALRFLVKKDLKNN